MDPTVTVTDELAAYTIGVDLDGLPEAVVRQARIVITDTVGLMLAAYRAPAVSALRSAFPANGGRCTVIGHGRGAAPEVAAFINAAAAHSLELDDSHSPSLTHPGSVLVPAALAGAELAGGVTGKRILEAVVAGYDVQARISRALGPLRQFDRGFHPLSVCGTIGAAAAAGLVLGLDHAKMLACFGLAASQSCGVLAFRDDTSHMHKAFHPAVAARNGVYAAMLARHGFQAATDVFGSRFGMLMPFGGPDAEPAELTAALGERYEILSTSIKRHPSCGRSHAPIDALMSLLAEQPVDPGDIQEIIVEVAHSTVVSIDARPQLTHNIQYLMAVVAIAGVLTEEHLGPMWSDRADVAALRERVVLRGTDELEAIFPAQRGAVITVRTSTGSRRAELTGPLGSPDRPLEDHQIRQKFAVLARKRRPAAVVDELYTLLANLQSVPTTDPLMALLGD